MWLSSGFQDKFELKCKLKWLVWKIETLSTKLSLSWNLEDFSFVSKKHIQHPIKSRSKGCLIMLSPYCIIHRLDTFSFEHHCSWFGDDSIHWFFFFEYDCNYHHDFVIFLSMEEWLILAQWLGSSCLRTSLLLVSMVFWSVHNWWNIQNRIIRSSC